MYTRISLLTMAMLLIMTVQVINMLIAILNITVATPLPPGGEVATALRQGLRCV